MATASETTNGIFGRVSIPAENAHSRGRSLHRPPPIHTGACSSFLETSAGSGDHAAMDAEKAARLRFLRQKYGVAALSLPAAPAGVLQDSVEALSNSQAPTAASTATVPAAAPTPTAPDEASAPAHSSRVQFAAPPRVAAPAAVAPSAAPDASAAVPRWTVMPSSATLESSAGTAKLGGEHVYRRLRQIGCGRFGEVYLVQEIASSRLLVLKSVHSRNIDAPARMEARTLLKLRRHPNIIALHDAFQESPERLCLVMEYADGGDLARRLTQARELRMRLGLDEAVHVFLQVALALQHCHRHAVFHRDVKPANVFLTLEGIVRLGDFGIAKDFKCVSALESGSKFAIAGTPLYMAPEALKAEPLGTPADAWSLGVILYEMLHPDVRQPFRAACLPALVRAIVTEPIPELPDAPEAVLPLVRGLLTRPPEQV